MRHKPRSTGEASHCIYTHHGALGHCFNEINWIPLVCTSSKPCWAPQGGVLAWGHPHRTAHIWPSLLGWGRCPWQCHPPQLGQPMGRACATSRVTIQPRFVSQPNQPSPQNQSGAPIMGLSLPPFQCARCNRSERANNPQRCRKVNLC